MIQIQARENKKMLSPGFSFIELVMAITIMAILTAGIVTVSVRYIAKAKVSGPIPFCKLHKQL